MTARLPRKLRWGAPGIVEVTLTNVSGAPLVVNTRLQPGYRDGSSRELFADVFFAGTDEPAARPALDYDRFPPQREDYAELAPGASLTGSFDLLDWYRLPGPGDYELVVSYEADERLAPPVDGLLRGVHASQRVPFSVR